MSRAKTGKMEKPGQQGAGAASMSREYGRIPRSGRKTPTAPEPCEIQINIPKTYTQEQFALEVQRAFHRLQECGASGLKQFRARLMPLDEEGRPMVLRDEQGQPVMTINIPEAPAEKPYRENEPGVGIETIRPAAMRQEPGSRPASPPTVSEPASAKRQPWEMPPRN